MQNILTNLVYPKHCPYCGKVQGFEPFCGNCKDILPKLILPKEKLSSKKHKFLAIEEAYSCFLYQEPIRSAILQMKNNHVKLQVKHFAQLIANLIKDVLPINKISYILYVPPYKPNKSKFDHGKILAEYVSELLNIPLRTDILYRKFNYSPQKQFTEQERKANVLGAYDVNICSDIKYKNVIIIDDVITTGCTINECAKMLQFYGCNKIYAVSIAEDLKCEINTVNPPKSVFDSFDKHADFYD